MGQTGGSYLHVAVHTRGLDIGPQRGSGDAAVHRLGRETNTGWNFHREVDRYVVIADIAMTALSAGTLVGRGIVTGINRADGDAFRGGHYLDAHAGGVAFFSGFTGGYFDNVSSG